MICAMELAHPLDGLDAHPWAHAAHAYGSAEDLPDVLRALTGDDQEAADEAISELYGSVIHQGTVYAASAEAAPFLARVAAAGYMTADVLRLLGDLAESDDEYGVEPGTVRRAVAAQLPLLIPLLGDADPEVRRAAVWAVGHTRAEAIALPEVRGRWDTEREPLVRAELLDAIARLDVKAATALAREHLDAEHPAPLRLTAVLVCLDAGVAWGPEHHDGVLSLLPASSLGAERLDTDRAEPLHFVVEALLRRATEADTTAAIDLLDAALRDGRTEVQSEAVWAAESAVTLSRSAADRLLPAVLALLGSAGTAVGALRLLTPLGPRAVAAAPALTALAAHPSSAPGDDLADRALAALVLVAPEEAAPLLARDLTRRPWALDAAAGLRAPEDTPFPFHPELLDAVRARLAEGELPGNEPWQLTRLLRQWGGKAAPALPELYAVLDRYPLTVGPAVAAVAADCPPDERLRAANALRPAAEDGPLAAARAHHDLTGDTGVLLARIGRALASGADDVRHAATVAGELGPEAAPLADALRAALSDADARCVTPVLDADVATADALWRITRDARVVVPVLDSVFARAGDEPWFRWTSIRAARVSALLGPAGRPLVPRLEALLADPEKVPSAVLALVAVSAEDSLDRPRLAGLVLTSAEGGADALEACDALAALGPDASTDDHLRRLTDLAERDLRVVRAGIDGEVVRKDELLRARAREVVAGWRLGPA